MNKKIEDPRRRLFLAAKRMGQYWKNYNDRIPYYEEPVFFEQAAMLDAMLRAANEAFFESSKAN